MSIASGPSSPPAIGPADRGGARRALSHVAEAAARLAALAAVFLYFAWLIPGGAFFSIGNVENILMQSAVYTMAGLGMTMIIITGGIDLAAGSIIALSMVVTAMALRSAGAEPAWYWPLLATLAGTAAAAGVGLVQGALITGLRVVPFIITLGGLVGVRGFVKEIADNQEISPPPGWLYENLMFPVQGRVFNWQLFPLGVWATIAAAAVAAAMLRYTRLGRRIYAIGSSEATARLCGVPVQRTKVLIYAIGGLFFGLAGVLEFSKLNLGQPTGAQMYELYIIAACVIGGTSLRGGVGTIFGTVVGALIIGVLNAGAQQAGWEKQKQEMAIGAIIILAVVVDQLRNRRRAAAA
jgi:ribose transport system permease protein/erythritol transport system permease protein